MEIWKGGFKKDMRSTIDWLKSDKSNKIDWLKRGLENG